MAFRRVLRFLSLWEFLVRALGLGRRAGVMTESRAASAGTSPRRQWADTLFMSSRKAWQGMTGMARNCMSYIYR